MFLLEWLFYPLKDTMNNTHYLVAELRALNPSYLEKCGSLKGEDVARVNHVVSLMEGVTGNPKPGDLVNYTDPETFKSYPKARVFKVKDDKAYLCLEAFTPHFSEFNTIDISGGPFAAILLNHLHYQGQQKASFWLWGSMGRGSGLGINFNCFVSVFHSKSE